MIAGRHVLVTGAGERSLGFATARLLVDRGAEVTVTTRSGASEVAERLGPGVVGHDLDLADRGSVDAFARWYAAERGRLDVLVNNAGVHLDLRSTWREPQLVDGHEIHWRVNYLGTWHLTSRLLPLLEEADDARVVNVVSKLHRRGSNAALFDGVRPYDSWAAYGTSKLALVHHASELGRRHPGVTGYALHPGEVYTRIADRGLETSPALARLRKVLAPVERRVLRSPEDGAATTVYCVTAPGLAAGYYRDSAPADPSPDARDEQVAARLWDETAAWLGTEQPERP
ncbi:NAD(P)-dependent dehydrogenase (short-subunit alcohol dehydrogenase family) [Nocardioides thalensis]|uniref:NAD(P)-dependent dehydrogenase (Short-subunit alcohol dehydrogenase family) n=1 Tax=Nocardioides thalensis TaxID=1914755 RepID=A0A853C7R2_9ACTN|nr:NAD(P)-dependent dehydrogenase (short-subunit alcohol dehydrogenase family) [Nocardioides thalensis]